MKHIVVWYSFPGVGKQALSCFTGDGLTWYDICGGQLGNVYERFLKIYIHSKSVILLLEISPIKKFTSAYICTWKDVHWSIVCNGKNNGG